MHLASDASAVAADSTAVVATASAELLLMLLLCLIAPDAVTKKEKYNKRSLLKRENAIE